MKPLRKTDFDLLNVETTPQGTKNTYVKLELFGYQEVGYIINSILSVCRQGLESTQLCNQFADDLDYSRLLGIAQSLIPFTELETIDGLYIDTVKNTDNADN